MSAFDHFVDSDSGRQFHDSHTRSLSGVRLECATGHFCAPLPVPPSQPSDAEIDAKRAAYTPRPPICTLWCGNDAEDTYGIHVAIVRDIPGVAEVGSHGHGACSSCLERADGAAVDRDKHAADRAIADSVTATFSERVRK